MCSSSWTTTSDGWMTDGPSAEAQAWRHRDVFFLERDPALSFPNRPSSMPRWVALLTARSDSSRKKSAEPKVPPPTLLELQGRKNSSTIPPHQLLHEETATTFYFICILSQQHTALHRLRTVLERSTTRHFIISPITPS